MKRKELLKRIASAGCVLVQHGGRHDLYANPKTGKNSPYQDMTKLMKILQNI
jgi:predicted RNA binding protein YcfA (HicA-like mRNA interferase family)